MNNPTQPPAWVLLDIGLPHVNGLELLAQMRKKSTWTGVPIVMLTAVADQTHICKAVVAGASVYILTPFKGNRQLPHSSHPASRG